MGGLGVNTYPIMLTINQIRENRDFIIERLKVKNFKADEIIDRIIQLDTSRREIQAKTDSLQNEKLVVTPLAYIRGRSISNVFFIVDEAQNLTPHEVKTIITRAGENTKIVFTGDIFQIDTPYLDSQSNGLSYLIDKIKHHPIYAHVRLEKGERSELANLANDLL